MLSCDGRHCICYLYANALPGRPCKLPGQANISCASRLPGTHLQRTEGVVVSPRDNIDQAPGGHWVKPAQMQAGHSNTCSSPNIMLEQNFIFWNDCFYRGHVHKGSHNSTAGHTGMGISPPPLPWSETVWNSPQKPALENPVCSTAPVPGSFLELGLKSWV